MISRVCQLQRTLDSPRRALDSHDVLIVSRERPVLTANQVAGAKLPLLNNRRHHIGRDLVKASAAIDRRDRAPDRNPLI
jgi:hypothetical protein